MDMIAPSYPRSRRPGGSVRLTARRNLLSRALLVLLVAAVLAPSGLARALVGEGPTAPAVLRIPAIGVNAGVETLGVVNGQMQDPTGPWSVGWYPAFGTPGTAGNTVFAGHVDYVGIGPAVFGGIGSLNSGAEIVVVGSDGRQFIYNVAWVVTYDLATMSAADVGVIVGQGGVEELTLITCGGAWDPVGQHYLSRTVVRATLVGASGASGATVGGLASVPEPDAPPDDGTGGPEGAGP